MRVEFALRRGEVKRRGAARLRGAHVASEMVRHEFDRVGRVGAHRLRDCVADGLLQRRAVRFQVLGVPLGVAHLGGSEI